MRKEASPEMFQNMSMTICNNCKKVVHTNNDNVCVLCGNLLVPHKTVTNETIPHESPVVKTQEIVGQTSWFRYTVKAPKKLALVG